MSPSLSVWDPSAKGAGIGAAEMSRTLVAATLAWRA